MKRKLTQAEFDALSDEMKALYKKVGDNYIVDLEGDDDANGELKRAKDREKQRADEAERKARELQEKLDGVSNDDARKRGDIEALEKSWKTKLDEANAKNEKQIQALKQQLIQKAIQAPAAEIAAKISTIPELLRPVIESRFAADFDENGNLTVRVKDAAGNLSALTAKELEAEIVANPAYAAIIVGSKGSGSGATGNNGGGAGSKALKDMSDAERTEYAQKDPEGFKQEMQKLRGASRFGF